MRVNGRFQIVVFAFLLLAFFALASQSASAGPVKNVIIMIADGQGFNTIQATDYYAGGQAVYESFPVQYAVTTYPLTTSATPGGVPNGSYNPALAWTSFTYLPQNPTDSAAAATALATGVKTYNNAICYDNNGQPITNIVDIAEAMGKSTGVVTSVQWSHATPASFGAHNISRNNYAQIAQEMINSGELDVIMGAGNPWYDNNGVLKATPNTYDYVGGSTMWNNLASGATPYTLIQTKQQFDNLANGTLSLSKVVGTAQVYTTLQQGRSGSTSVPYAAAQNANVPTLGTMAQGALNVLSADADGFFLMVEGGAIDTANHSNQAGRMIEEEQSFNSAVQAVVNWVNANSDWNETLLIVTADHETGYLWGPGSNPTFTALVNNGAGAVPGLKFNSGGHTNTPVPLFAIGAGSWMFNSYATGNDPRYGAYLDNTNIFAVMDTAMSVPEPMTISMLLLGAGMLAIARRKQAA